MKIEHVAFNVEDPVAMGKWYVDHLGLKVKRRTVEPPFGHFLTDDSGAVMIEIYKNPSAAIPDYHNIQPFTLHLALTSTDVDADIKRLTEAGATLIGDVQSVPQGDTVAMLRDPWGFCIQLVKRASPMISAAAASLRW